MHRTLFTSVTAGVLALFMVTACAQDSKGTETTAEQVSVTAETSGQAESAMDQPVDFSTPENVEKSLQKVREQDGEVAYKNLVNAMKYVSYYDLSVGGNKEKLHKKLNGQTPNQIIAKAKR